MRLDDLTPLKMSYTCVHVCARVSVSVYLYTHQKTKNIENIVVCVENVKKTNQKQIVNMEVTLYG